MEQALEPTYSERKCHWLKTFSHDGLVKDIPEDLF